MRKFAQETVNICSNCSEKIQCFTESMKAVTNKLSEGVKLINNDIGEAMQSRCSQYFDNMSRTKEIASLKENLTKCLA